MKIHNFDLKRIRITKKLLGITLGLLVLIFAGGTTYAARSGGTSCSDPDDTNLFPHGFICGSRSDSNYTNGGNGGFTSGTTPGGNVLAGDTISIRSGFTATNEVVPANAEVLVWITINGPTQLTQSSNTIVTSGNTSLKCPGVGSGGPGPVFGYRDLAAGVQYNNSSASNGNEQSPGAYSPSENKGYTDCGSDGRMVYWRDGVGGNSGSVGEYGNAGSHQGFDLDYYLDPTKTSNGNNVCFRMNISVKTGAGQSYFPPSAATFDDTITNPSVAASHIAKQSEERCYNVINNEPTGTFNCTSAASFWVTGADIDVPGSVQARVYRLTAGAGSPASVTYTQVSATSAASTHAYAFSAAWYRVYIQDANTGVWYPKTERQCPPGDSAPSYSLAVSCGGVLIQNLFDPQDPGTGVRMEFRAQKRNADGSFTPAGLLSFQTDQPRTSGDYFYTWPWGREGEKVDKNYGWKVLVGSYDINPDGTEDGVVMSFSAEVDGSCYQATCSLDIVSRVPGTVNGVLPGKPFDVNVTISNPPNNVGVKVTRLSDSFEWNAFTPTNPLPGGFPTGHALSVTSDDGAPWGLPSPWSADFPETSDPILWNTSQTGKITLNAPPLPVTSSPLTLQPDYWQLMRIGPACGGETSVVTYQPFKLTPVADVPTADPDNEDPSTIDYVTRVTQELGLNPDGVQYITTPFSRTTTSKLFYAKYATGYDAPDLHNESRTQAYGNGSYLRTFTDQILNSTQFRAGDSWNAGDQFCGRIEIPQAKGWIGPGGITADVQPDADQKCDIVANEPFVRSYMGDVMAGGQFGSAGTAGSGEIKGYIRGGHAGSGVEYGAFAKASIQGYASAIMRTVLPMPRDGLSFANSGAGAPGNFALSRIGIDWFGETMTAGTLAGQVTRAGGSGDKFLIQAASPWNADKQYYAKTAGATPLYIGGAGNLNDQRALYVEGDVFIENNIGYRSNLAPGGDLSKIPNFTLVVKGNIYISQNVTELDGLYVAQPNGASGGTIYTCVDPSGVRYTTAGQLFTNCSQQLTVNGSFVSQTTKFLRTNGTMRQIPSSGATADTPGSPGIDGASWSWTGLPSGLPAGTQCTKISEPSDPNWIDDNNYICYKSQKTLNWYYGGPSGAPTDSSKCISFNHPGETAGHTWSDNWLCVSDGSDIAALGMQIKWNSVACPTGVGKGSTALYEAEWNNNVSEGGTDPWGTGKVNLCYNNEVGFSAGDPPSYDILPFSSGLIAERFRLSPEVYLSTPAFKSKNPQNSGKYNAITTLPPIL